MDLGTNVGTAGTSPSVGLINFPKQFPLVAIPYPWHVMSVRVQQGREGPSRYNLSNSASNSIDITEYKKSNSAKATAILKFTFHYLIGEEGKIFHGNH